MIAGLPLTLVAKGSIPPSDAMDMKPEQLFASTQCPTDSATTEASSQWITSQGQLDQFYKQLNEQIVGGGNTPAPRIDFFASAVLLFHMGQKKTGGYGLQLPDQQLDIQDTTAVLHVKWMEPPADAMVIQVLTNPCMLVRMPLGEYRRVVVVDQNNTTRTSLSF